MKKEICFLVCCITVLAVTSCGEKAVKGANGKEYETYQEAVRNQDFEAAYIFVDRVENSKGHNSEEFVKIRDYVVSSEISFLLSLNTEEASNRVIFLISEIRPPEQKIAIGDHELFYEKQKEEKEKIDAYHTMVETYNKQCTQILDLAIQNDNFQLAQSILKSFVPSMDIESRMEKQGKSILGKLPDHLFYNISYSNRALEDAIKKFNLKYKDEMIDIEKIRKNK